MPDGADMLSYKTPGNYYCTSDARSKTLLNCPVKKAFTLKVDLANGDNYPRQTFATISNVTYSRTYDPYQNLWVDAKTIMTDDKLPSTLNHFCLKKTIDDGKPIILTFAEKPLRTSVLILGNDSGASTAVGIIECSFVNKTVNYIKIAGNASSPTVSLDGYNIIVDNLGPWFNAIFLSVETIK